MNHSLLGFAGVAFILTITPGADTLLVMRSVLTADRRAGLITNLGIGAGLLTHALLSSLGLSLILMRSATAFEIVKLAGSLYLIYLGVQAIVHAFKHKSSAKVLADTKSKKTIGQFFRSGFLTNLLNPKVALFYLAFLPQFIHPNHDPLLQSVLLSSIHLVLSFVWLLTIATFVERLKQLLTHPKFEQGLEAMTGFILVSLGMKLAIDRQ